MLRGTEFEGPVDLWTNIFNVVLHYELQQLRRYGLTIVEFDTAGLFNDVLDNPIDYSFTNVVDAACPDCGLVPNPEVVEYPDEYLWWDPIHPTRVGHAIAGEAASMALQWRLSLPAIGP
jgi:phospholipase/lecithinase/hemolysin